MPEPKPKATSLSNQATIVVTLPADAKLSIDDMATSSTSATRVFVSPTLPAGKDFTYVLKAEVTREGKTMTTSKVVTVRAGQESRVSFEFPMTVAQR